MGKELVCQEIFYIDKSNLIAEDFAREPKEGLSDYALSLYCAGVDVIAFNQFGSYQGEWWAKIKFPTGEEFYVSDYYGSCSGCDAFEADFGWSDSEKPDYAHRLRDFGRQFLEKCYTKEDAIKEASRNIEWDHDAEEMVNWIKDN